MRFSHRRRLKPTIGIDMTPILDVTFQLLITFIIIAPTLKHGVNLTLPKATAEQISEKKPLTVYITKKNWVYLDEQHLELDSLKELLQTKYESNPLLSIYVEADAKVDYEIVAKVIAIIKQVGIERVGLVTEPQ